jgi:hypothetical protein
MIPSAISRESEGLPSRNLIIKTSASREYFIFIETSASEVPFETVRMSKPKNLAILGCSLLLEGKLDLIASQFGQPNELDDLFGGLVLLEQAHHLGRRSIKSVRNHTNG